MGHHYVPQAYLCGFEVPAKPGMIWTYDKKNCSCKCLPIKSVAQSPGFYDADVEAELAEKLEWPANFILKDLGSRKGISEEQRIHFAIYIASMMKRVPRRRRITRERILPSAIASTVEGLKSEVLASKAVASDPQLLLERLAEIERISEALRKETPKEVTDQIASPWPTVKMISAVAAMTWRMALTRGPQHFITSDNPAFFFDNLGIGTPAAEIAFPIDPGLALIGSRQGRPGNMIWVEVRQKVVREVNVRMVAGAERLIFSQEKQSWLPAVMAKPQHHLNRIAW
jgi:hypothetical protein